MTGLAMPGRLGTGAATVLRLAERAADAGLSPVLFTELSHLDAAALAGALAAARPGTPTGTGIVPFGSRSVASIAMAARTAAELSRAPYHLGVGLSTRQIVEGWHGARYDATVATARRRLTELRDLLDGRRRGSFALPPGEPVPIRVLLGALGPRMTRVGLEYADGVILNHTPPGHLPAPGRGDVLAYCWIPVCEDGHARVRRDLTSYCMADPYARHFARLGYADAVARVRSLHAAGRLREAPATLPADLVELLFPTPQELPGRLAAFEAAGATPLVAPVTGDHPVEEVEAFLQRRPWEG